MSLTLGGNITLQGSISHTVLALTPIDTINYTAAKWGYIEGTLSDQTDLLSALNAKANSADLATVATSGAYSDLIDLPTIPTKVSDLTNDSGYLTENDVAPVATSGDYDDLSNKPNIPENISDLNNDSDFVESTDLATVATSGSYADLSNKPTTIPSGGTSGQVLAKASNTDYDIEWANGGGGGAVDSVNGKTGTVVLDADDVGALPDTTTASDLGAYVKPSGGIPKSDLASAVQTSLNKADTALQSAPVTSVNGQTGAVVISNATTSSAGLMSATDKQHLEAVYADYSSAITALGV